ncbi:hypothetical protein PRIPAC_89206 [Pristionchus pacificus]|nr:hypothetical protein PRIPAC_89206 [Pristionchus pacificus]
MSGYLISSILSRRPSLTQFYKRRFIRIVPVYAAMLLVVVSIAAFLFAPTDFADVATSTKWCLIFARNIHQILESKDYWAQTSEFSQFLHTWSLAVEIQFYLVAPLLHFIITSTLGGKLKIPKTLTLAAVSMIFYSLSDATSQFYSLHCRIWQFMLGFLVACSSVKIPEVFENRLRWASALSFCLTMIISVVVLGGFSTGADRIVVSTCAALLILIGEVHQSRVLTNPLLTVIGNYSYELYLIHWPVIVAFQYSMMFDGIEKSVLLVLMMITFFLVLLKIYYDINRLKATFKTNFVYTSIIYAVIIAILIVKAKSNHLEQKDSTDDLRTSAMKWAMGYEFFPLPPHEKDREATEWKSYRNPSHVEFSYLVRGSGNLSILLLGNSFGFRASPVIAEVLTGSFRILRVFTELGCPILTSQSNCTKFHEAFKIVLEKMKPDITWVIAKEPGFFTYSEAELAKQVESSVQLLKVHSKIVIIDGQSDYFGFKLDPRMTMIRRLQLRKMNFSDLQTSREAFFEKKRGHLHDKLQNHSALHQKEWEVMRSISGPTILFNNVSEQMCDADACPLYNAVNLHHYYGDRDGHFNQEGLKRLRPGYEAITREAVKILGYK